MTDVQYYQNDPQWKDVKIGTDAHMTIGMVGCLLTSLTMVMNHFGAKETPLSLNQRMVASGGFNGAWIKSAMVPSQYPQLGVKRQKYVECKNKPAPMADIDTGLAAGSLVVVQVDREEDRAFEDEDGHWVVLVQKEGDDYLMWDPWQKQGAPDTLVARYGFGYKKPEEIVQAAIWHGTGEMPKTEDKPAAPSPPATPAAGDDQPMAVKPAVDQLTLRRTAVIEPGNVMKTLSARDVLRVLDPPSAARGQIGRQGQWLRVREPQGSEGYVAAWLVQETAVAETAGSPQREQQPAAKLQVKINAESVSFRSEPRVADDTLISYLPQGTVLQVIEGGTPASKIGVNGQWLQVQTEAGQQGYVAAWLVARV